MMGLTTAVAGIAMLMASICQAAIPQAERAALTALYESTNGAEWLIVEGWRNDQGSGFAAPGSECGWYGISCDAAGEHVISVRIQGNNLQGPIPPEIGALTSLVELDLSTNGITALPDELFSLPVSYLFLQFNQIAGPIPAALGSMSQLQYLLLANNRFTGPIPPELGDLAKLEALGLSSNQIEGTIPAELGQLSSLRYLELAENGLTGPIPPELGNLRKATNIMLVFNQLEGEIPPELGQLSSCRGLFLSYNQLEGSIPATLGQLTSLQFLSLQHNQLRGPIPPELSQLTLLEDLNLVENQLTGPVPPELGDMVALERLRLSRNQLSGTIPPQLGKMSALISLMLNSNHLEGPIPAELGMLRHLESLALSANQLSGEVPHELVQLTKLNLLSLDLNALSSSDPEVLDFIDRLNYGAFELTQSVPPTGLAVTALDPGSAELSWTPLPETSFDVPMHTTALVARAPDGPYLPWGDTETREDDRLVLTGLLPGVTYRFAAQTTVAAHEYNDIAVPSVLSDPVTLTMPGQAPPISELGDRVVTVPAVAHIPGALGTRWRSDVVMHNPGPEPANVTVAFAVRDQTGLEVEPVSWSVASGRSLRLDDVVEQMTPGVDAAGVLLVGSSAELIVSSRSFNDSTGGSFGQYIPAETATAALTTRTAADLVQLSGDASFRTNVGIVNPGSVAARAAVELSRADGELLGSELVDVPACGAIQLNDVFSGSVVTDGRAQVTTSTPGAQLHAYASVVDNRSGDPVYVRPARPVWDELWIPGVAHVEGANQTAWRSDLEVFNPGPGPATYRLELFLRGGESPSASAARFTLDEGQARRHMDVVHELFAVTGAGAIRIRLEGGRVAASCRTYNDNSNGTFGQFIPAEPGAVVLDPLTPARLVQLAHSADGVTGSRTNIGVVNTADVPLKVTAELYDGNGNRLGRLTAELGPFGNTQLNDVFRSVVDEDLADGFAVLSGDNPLASYLAYASVVDNRSGDPVYVAAVPVPAAR